MCVVEFVEVVNVLFDVNDLCVMCCVLGGGIFVDLFKFGVIDYCGVYF